jgi:hypothetical protein
MYCHWEYSRRFSRATNRIVLFEIIAILIVLIIDRVHGFVLRQISRAIVIFPNTLDRSRINPIICYFKIPDSIGWAGYDAKQKLFSHLQHHCKRRTHQLFFKINERKNKLELYHLLYSMTSENGNEWQNAKAYARRKDTASEPDDVGGDEEEYMKHWERLYFQGRTNA